jgi:hypothetical protein
MGSVVIPHLVSGWHVDQAIISEEERLVVIRFGRDWDPECMRQDEVLYRKSTLIYVPQTDVYSYFFLGILVYSPNFHSSEITLADPFLSQA